MSDKDICDHDATREIQNTIAAMEGAKHKLDTLMSEGQSKEVIQQSLVVSKTSTQTSSTLDDWKTFTSSIPDDWSSSKPLSAAAEDNATNGRKGLMTKAKSPQPSLSPSRLKSRGLSPLAHYEETTKSTQLKETRISRSASPGNKLTSVSQEKLDEEWKRNPTTSSHVSDKSTSFLEYRESPSSQKMTSPVSPKAILSTQETLPQVSSTEHVTSSPSVVRIHPIQLSNGDGSKVAETKTDADKLLKDDELKNDPLLKHINESKEWLQLKILEMEPGLAKVGTNLEDALEYQRQHEEVLLKLQGKQSPVEELLNQADQLISTQKPRAEVYAAMAESLGLAWHDLNNQLERRKQLLEQSVAFHSRAKEFSDRLDKGERECQDTLLPTDAEVVRKVLQQHHDMKKAILEASMHTLNEGQTLLERLKEVATRGTEDSRPGHLREATNSAIYHVEHLMETLHDRRRRFEDLWAKRKLLLEQCLQLCLLYSDIAQVRQWLQTKGQDFYKVLTVGDTPARAEILQHEHSKVELEAKQVQDRAIRLLRTAEQLNISGHYAGSEAESKTYELLDNISELTNNMESRRNLLAMAVSFFRAAQSALTKLDQVEVQLSTTDRSSSNLAQQHAQIAQTIEEIVRPPLQEGYLLLDKTGKDHPGVQGVVKTVGELEERRKKLDGLCTAHRAENLQKSAAVKTFQTTFNNLFAWIVKNGDTFLQGHQDMGSVLAMAKDFCQRHEQLLKDVHNKGPELEAVYRSLPNLLKSAPEDASEIDDQMEKLRNIWMAVNANLENRIRLAQLYVSFHRLAVQLANDMDSLEATIVAIRDGTQPITDVTASNIEEKWLTISQTYLQLKNTGKNFIFDAKRSKDPYLDIQRAILCVETLLEHFLSRQQHLSNLRDNWQSNIVQNREIRTQWEKYVVEVQKTIQWVTTIEVELYPVIAGDVMNVQSIIWDLERKLENFVPNAKKAQSELDLQIKSSESLLLKGDQQQEKDKILSELSDISQKLGSYITEYQILISMLIAYFKKVFEIEKMVEKMEMQYAASLLPTEVRDVEMLLKEHEASHQALVELFNFSVNERTQVVAQIRSQEPEAAGRVDEEKLIRVLELIQQHWEKAWQEHKRHLEQHLQLCQFNQDLRQINNQLNELSIQLSSIRGNYGESLPAAKATSQAFIQFEKTIELLEQRIKIFVSTAEKMLSDEHVEKQHIKFEIGNLQSKWSTFHMQVGENRKLIDLSIDYFKLIEEAEEWFKEGSKLLIQIARKSTSCHSPNEAINLLNEVEIFLRPGEAKQQERLRKISTLATQIYGHTTPVKIDTVAVKNREMLDSFMAINEELNALARNLRTAEQEREKHLKEKEEVDAALASAKAEAAAAKAAAAAAEEARRAAEAAAREIPPTRVIEHIHVKTIQRTEAIPTLPEEREPRLPPQEPLSPSVLLDKKVMHVAPQFIIPLKDAEVDEGTKFKFVCKVTGLPAPDVQWYKDGIAIINNPDYQTEYNPSSGMCALTIEETFSEDSAKFTCKAGNAAGVVETHGKLTVKEPQPAEEYLSPEFLVELKASQAKVGEPHQLECHVTGNPLPVVSWYKDDACIDNSSDFKITYNNGVCLLGFEQLKTEDDARYTCRATNTVGTASSTAKLTVEPAELVESPSFPQPLSNVMARAGQKLRLECCVRGIPQPDITWLHNNKPVKETREAKISVEDGKIMLTILEAFPKDAGTYVVIAKNRAGEATSSCTVTVKGRLPLETSDSELASDLEPVKPRILQMLKDITIPEHSKVRMDCIIVGQPEPEVIWYHDGIPVKESNDFQLLFEGDKCSLIIREAYAEDAGEYRIVAINSAGEASSLCTIYVKPALQIDAHVVDAARDMGHKLLILSTEKGTAPKFTSLLTDRSVTEGDSILLQCSVSGDPEPVITWLKDGTEITTGESYQISRESFGVQKLRISGAKPDHIGSYTLKATNIAGEAKCLCNVTVTRPVPVVPPLEPPLFKKLFFDQIVKIGQPVTFDCVITGKPKQVQWYFKGEPITAQDFTITMEDDQHGLYIPALKPENAGRYTCTAENDKGKATCTANLVVSEPAQLIIPIDGDFTVADGNTQKSFKMTSVTKSTSVMQKTFSSSSSSTTDGLKSGNVEYHKLSTQEEHAMQKLGDQPAQETRSSKKEEIHKKKVVSRISNQSTTLQALTNGYDD